ncbi:MAG: GLUG motif-containing protein [Solirubrobacterales bacterium]
MSFAGGSGTTADPYLVSTEAQLEALNDSSYPTCAFRQTQDIALAGTTWAVIGFDYAHRFRGEYDGGGHLISNLNVSTTHGSAYQGLFGYTVGATIKNLRVSGVVDIPGGFGNGALVGLADTGTRVENVHSSVNVTSGGRVGGLIGWAAEVTVSRSSSTGDVTGTDNSVGGLIGYARGSSLGLTTSVSDSYATGSVTGAAGYRGIAGLIGAVDGSAPGVRVTNSYSAGSITGGTGSRQECTDPNDPNSCYTVVGTTGGLVALDYDGSPYGSVLGVTDSFWDTQTSGRATTAENKGTGKTTAEMKNIATFSGASWDIANGWDASKVWGICDGSTYPFLTGQYTASPCPAPTPTPTPEPSPDPTPTPTPDPGPSPTPTPSNAFSMRAPGAIGSSVTSTVRVPGPGRLVMRATRNSNVAARLTACRVSKEVDRARSVVLTCRANAATRAAQRRGAVRLSVTVTYTPTGGTARTSAARTVVLKSTKPSYTG